MLRDAAPLLFLYPDASESFPLSSLDEVVGVHNLLDLLISHPPIGTLLYSLCLYLLYNVSSEFVVLSN